ncbi:unnamed protein product [Meloidogyne enterolobii]|uniref:Uncharacterized protein n=1 Tax=Meloidogyne enterolobii TaxID=390850 RepID=A0ACB0YZY4_MELEN
MAFVDGKCSELSNCQKNLITNNGQCVEGHTLVHPRDCSKYLLCRYGQYVEESCHLGHRQCDPKYACLSTHIPPCFEGELRPIISPKTTECQSEYETCRDGKFYKQICPYGERFYLGKCEAFDKCGNNNGINKNNIGENSEGIYEKCQASFLMLFTKNFKIYK